jgi:hypothetical protein
MRWWGCAAINAPGAGRKGVSGGRARATATAFTAEDADGRRGHPAIMYIGT